MANFGWAYVDCMDIGPDTAGPTGSVQFLTGTNSTSGSASFMYHTAAIGAAPDGYAASTLILTGTLIVSGTISASMYHIEDIALIDATGSTFFGNSTDDIHSRTGSLEIWSGSTSILSASAYSQQTFVRGFGGMYTNVTSSHHTAATSDYILGVTTAGNIKITVPSPVVFSPGAVLVIKDEVSSNRGASNITLTRSVTDTYTFDGAPLYVLTGTMPALNLYSNGSNWFVF